MGIVFPLVYLDNPSGDAQRDGLDSSYNFSNVMASLALVEDLLADEVLPGKEMVILTPYQAQWMRYLDYLDCLRKQRPDLRIADVSAFKADSFQGAEASVVIVDLLVTTKAGFVGQANRLNVSLSRAKYGMCIVASMDILEVRGVGSG
jgi:superfamily I DNA and/or RNA helicase